MTTTDAPNTIVALMAGGMAGDELRQAAASLDAGDVDKLIAEARARLTLAATYNRDEELGLAIQRCDDVYRRAHKAGDLKTALAAQKEKAKLQHLYNARPDAPAGGAPGETDADRELAAVAGHLFPLGLAAPDYPVSGHARIAAERIREHP